MTQRSVELHFVGEADVQLAEARFIDKTTSTDRVTVRGKTAGAFRDAGTFQWTSAVRGLCILFARAKVAKLLGDDVTPGRIIGGRGTIAASLDSAVTKQPMWIRDVFGNDCSGHALAQRLISRTNPNRKRPGPVILSVNERALAVSEIAIVWNNKRIKSLQALRSLLLGLGDGEQAQVTEADAEATPVGGAGEIAA
jgi:hypothetical protein